MIMELRQLRYFIAVAEERSFSRAAVRAGVSQPPLSRQIAKLETEIGVELFKRNKHGVQVTQAGITFEAEVKSALAQLDYATKAARRAAKGQIGTLSLGFGGSAVYTFTPSLLKRFRRDFPDVELALHNVPVTSQLDALIAKRIDIGFLLLPVRNDAIATRVLLRDTLNVALPSGHHLCRRKEIPLSALSDCDFIVFPRAANFGFHGKVMELCAKANFIPKVVQEISPLESVIGLVAAGVGIAVVPSVARKFKIAEVVFRPIRERFATVNFAMAWRKTDNSPVVRSFVEMVEKSDLC
jgi:DNA-binding transcriptional LysR family regulator